MNHRVVISLVGMFLFISSGRAEDTGFLGVVLGNPAAGSGAVIREIIAESPADRDGLRVGDLVVSANDTEIGNAQKLLDTLGERKSGDKVILTIQRAGGDVKLTVQLTDRPDKPITELPLKKRPMLGVAIAITENGGVVVAKIFPDSPAETAGLTADDVIAACDGLKIRDYDELAQIIAAHKAGDSLDIELTRGGETLKKTIILKAYTPLFGGKGS